MQINYSTRSNHPIRDDYSESHSRYWQRLASAGNWLTGTQRVAVAKEVRAATSCKLCAECKIALFCAAKGDGILRHRRSMCVEACVTGNSLGPLLYLSDALAHERYEKAGMHQIGTSVIRASLGRKLKPGFEDAIRNDIGIER